MDTINLVRKYFPTISNIANEILDIIQDMKNEKNLVTTTKSGNKVIISINFPGITRDDFDLITTENGLSIEIRKLI